MANVWAYALAVVGVVIMLTSLLTWTAYMLPRPVARAQRQIEARPWQSFFVGLVVLAIGAGVYLLALSYRKQLTIQLDSLLDSLANYAGVARHSGDAGTVAHELLYIPMIPFMIAVVIGGAAFAHTFSQRVDSVGNRPLWNLVMGAFFLSCSLFLPLIGWFAFLPIVTAMSVGAGMLSLFSRDPAPSNG